MHPTFSAIGIVVEDMDRSLAFYRRLGLAVPEDAGGPHAEIPLAGGLRFLIDTRETIQSFDPAWSAPAGSPRVSIAFDCGSPDAVDATFRDLVGAGATPHLEPWDAFWGQRYATLRDPDGNGIDLFAARA
jgi:catechol 2,3-dioxygenase-like lactoylglutathione lyase family enzyme